MQVSQILDAPFNEGWRICCRRNIGIDAFLPRDLAGDDRILMGSAPEIRAFGQPPHSQDVMPLLPGLGRRRTIEANACLNQQFEPLPSQRQRGTEKDSPFFGLRETESKSTLHIALGEYGEPTGL